MTAILILHNFSPRELRQCQINGPLIIERRVRPSANAFLTRFLQIDLEKKIILGDRRHVSVYFSYFFEIARTRTCLLFCVQTKRSTGWAKNHFLLK